MPHDARGLAAVVLAGGRSRRMGTDKALISLGGMTLIERVAAEAALVAAEVWISANDPAPYRFLGRPVIPDRFPGRGPLAGLDAGFASSEQPAILLLACDLPNVRAPWLAALAGSLSGWDAVLPVTSDGRLHPLCAVYGRTCRSAVERNLRAGIHKMTAIFDAGELRLRRLGGSEGGFRDTDLANLNSPADLSAILSISGGQAP
jgi:molybdopterin-guanine dinucleotide biosynthesis protein A